MTRPIISAIGHVALRVTDLEGALWTATNVMGLRESERVGEWVYLTNGADHHSLQLAAGDADALDHVGLVANGSEGLQELRMRLEAEAIPLVSDGPLDEGIAEGLAFQGPEGFTFEVYTGMRRDQPRYVPTGIRPTRFGHVNLYVADPAGLVVFLRRVLDFRISDHVGAGAFLRCNADHHGIGVGQAEPTRIHHMAWEVEGIADLARLGDVLDDHDRHLIWGPVRHGVGRNVAAYFVDFGSLIVEYYSDMQRIYDEATFEPGRWEREDPRFFSLWTRHDLGDFREHGLQPVVREPAARS
jgi:catechol 2,3-dioxygenase